MNYNLVVLMGRMVEDPELRYTPTGTPVCSFTLAINRVYKDAGGVKHEESTFVDCSAFNQCAEWICKIKKGEPVLLDGRLKQESWKDKTTNENRYKLKVIVDSFQFLQPAADAPEPTPAPRRTLAPQGKAQGLEDSDAPF